MGNYILNNAPYRTRPHFITSRLNNQELPGPYYGNRSRLRSDIITESPKDWRETVAVSKLYPDLQGLGQTLSEAQGMVVLFTKVETLLTPFVSYATEKYRILGSAYIGLAKSVVASNLATRETSGDYLASAVPDLSAAYLEAGDIRGSLAMILARVKSIRDEIVRTGGTVTSEQRAFKDSLKPIIEQYESELTPEERAALNRPRFIEMGIGSAFAKYTPKIWRAIKPYLKFAIGAVTAYEISDLAITAFAGRTPEAAIAGWTSGIDKLPIPQADKDAAKRRALAAGAMSFEDYLKSLQSGGGILSMLGYAALAIGGLYLVTSFFTGKGFMGDIGRGIAMRTHPRERRPSYDRPEKPEKRPRGRPRKTSKFQI